MSEDNITGEEMKKGMAPTRQELIMNTPVAEVLKKTSWDDIDLEILVMHKHLLDEETLAKIGILPPKAKTAEEVAAETAKIKEDATTAEAAAAQKVAQEEAAEAQRKAEEEAVKTETPVKTDEVVDNKVDNEKEVVDNKQK